MTATEIPAENYPFCTIDPNVGVVPVPDQRLDRDDALADALAVVPQLLEGDFEDAMLKLHSRGVTPKPYRKKQKGDSTEDKA